jgi:outer membrane protein assembly factor BamE (lipoprotein component of BamABCDE complex)
MRCRSLPIVALATLLAGCGPEGFWSTPGFWTYEPQVRGNMVAADQLKQLVPGTSTEADATALLGSPTTKASFDPNTWIYVGQVTRPQIAAFQKVEKQDTVVLSFNSAGVLEKIEQKSGKDSLPAPMIAGATPSPGNNPSILQQVLGNVGRYSATPTGQGQGPSSGAPGTGNY